MLMYKSNTTAITNIHNIGGEKQLTKKMTKIVYY